MHTCVSILAYATEGPAICSPLCPRDLKQSKMSCSNYVFLCVGLFPLCDSFHDSEVDVILCKQAIHPSRMACCKTEMEINKITMGLWQAQWAKCFGDWICLCISIPRILYEIFYIHFVTKHTQLLAFPCHSLSTYNTSAMDERI